MDYHRAYYILWKTEHDKANRLEVMLDEIMLSYEKSIETQKAFLKEIIETKQKVNDLEEQNEDSYRWCCRRTRSRPPY
jgi:hypothetical protein